jgi:hypothetical protein
MNTSILLYVILNVFKHITYYYYDRLQSVQYVPSELCM